MGVNIQGDGHGAVAQPLLDDLGVDTGQEQERRMGMPQIMEANPPPTQPPGQYVAGYSGSWARASKHNLCMKILLYTPLLFSGA